MALQWLYIALHGFTAALHESTLYMAFYGILEFIMSYPARTPFMWLGDIPNKSSLSRIIAETLLGANLLCGPHQCLADENHPCSGLTCDAAIGGCCMPHVCLILHESALSELQLTASCCVMA
jgi:hypothetical protein